MNHPNDTCTADCDACRNRRLAEAFQKEADDSRELLFDCAKAMQSALDSHAAEHIRNDTAYTCGCGDCTKLGVVMIKLIGKGIHA